MCIGAGAMQGIGLFTNMMGAGMQASAARRQAEAQARAYEYQAAMQEENARLAEARAKDAVARGGLEEVRFRKEASQFLGTQKAAIAAGGVETDTGSPLALLTDTAEGIEEDAATIRYNAQMERWEHLVDKTNQLNQATLSRFAAANTRTAGKEAARSSLIGGMGQVADYWYRTGSGAFDTKKPSKKG